MNRNPYAPAFEDLPEKLPIFPLAGVLLLPNGQLPLNIFEPRYRAMVEDAMAGMRLIGMVQPQDKDLTCSDITNNTPVFSCGCAGKITEFSETSDGRYQITLTGISRFNVGEMIATNRGYRQTAAKWDGYEEDLNEQHCLNLDRDRLKALLCKYFDKEGMNCDWQAVDDAPDGRLITCLSMVCPFDASEKQALLEAECGRARAQLFMTMLEMAVCAASCKSHH